MKSSSHASSFFAFLLVLTFGVCSELQAEETIKIGFNLSLSGPRAATGISQKKGLELLLEEINSGGGVQVGEKKFPVEFIYADNETKLDKAVAGALKAITGDKVLGLIGPNSSSRAIPVGGFAQSFKTPMISPTSTNLETTSNRPFVFRACFLDDFQGEVMARFASDHFKAKRAAVLFNMDDAYPKELANFFKKSFEKQNGAGSVSAYEAYQSDSSNLSEPLRKITKSGADVLFLPQYSNDLPGILKQIRAAGWNKPVLGGDGWESPDLVEKCGDLCKGLFFSAHFAALEAKGAAKVFVEKYKAKYNEMPDGYSALGYDATKLMLTAVSNLKNLDSNLFKARKDVASELAKIKDFEGVSGTLHMNSSGDPAKSAVIILINDNGKFESYTTINP